MAKWHPCFENFAEVEQHYNTTEPVIARVREDLVYNQAPVPTNCRNRKYEQVIKISKNEYALLDDNATFMHGLMVRYDSSITKDKDKFLKIVPHIAPIVWRKHRGGTETMTVRNVTCLSEYEPNVVSRMDFLYRHLPRRWGAHCHGGNHYVCPAFTNEKFVLPKHNFVPQSIVKMLDENASGYDRQNYPLHVGRENKQLVFTRSAEGVWSGPSKVYNERKWRIDKDRKAKYKPAIDKFFEDAAPIGAMLETNGSDNDIHGLFTYLSQETSQGGWSFSGLFSDYGSDVIDCNKVRSVIVNIMKNPDHEHWLGLVKCAVSRHAFRDAKSRYSWVTKVFNLKRKMEVPTES